MLLQLQRKQPMLQAQLQLQPHRQRQQQLKRLKPASASNAASSATAAASSATSASSSASTATTKASRQARQQLTQLHPQLLLHSQLLKLHAAANFEVLDDTTPQLGGNLDTNEKEIVTVSNRDLVLAPNGTGAVEIKGNTNSGKYF